MNKYLIKSVYSYYDDWDIQDVCICETKEKAEQYIAEFQKNIEVFKNIDGYRLFLDNNIHADFISICEPDKVINNHNIVYVFLTEEEYQNLKMQLTEDEAADESSYIEECTYFNFMTLHYDKTTITQKYCNHEEARLIIEELEYLE